MDLYVKLLALHGPQAWWPVTPEGKLHPQYLGRPKNQKQQFEIMVGAILTQNTNWKNVEKALVNLHREGLMDTDAILDADHDVLAQTIRPSGYYNQKAKKLKRMAGFIREHPIEELEKMDLAVLRQKLLSIKGVGPETADSIILYALEKPSFVVDAYTKRIFSNLGLIEKGASYSGVQFFFEENLEPDVTLYQEYHALIVEHATQYYKGRKERYDCPLLQYIENDYCQEYGYASNNGNKSH